MPHHKIFIIIVYNFTKEFFSDGGIVKTLVLIECNKYYKAKLTWERFHPALMF